MEPFVPVFVKIFYPFALLSVGLFFMYADLDLGGTVSILMAANGKSAEIGPVFSFTLLATVVDAWNSGALVISVLVFTASGLWPFVKLTLLSWAWFAPPSRLSRNRRGRLLYLLDIFGKYGFLDSWFLVLTMNAFSMEWKSIGTAFMMVETNPLQAFYVFFVCTALSLALGHVASEAHVHACKNHHRLSEGSEPVALAAAELFKEDTPRSFARTPTQQPRMHAAATSDLAAAASPAPGPVQASAPPAQAAAPTAPAVPAVGDASPARTMTEIDLGSDGASSDSQGYSSAGKDSEKSESTKCMLPLCLFAESRLQHLSISSGLLVTLALVLASVTVTSFDFLISGIFTEFIVGGEVSKEYSLTTLGVRVSNSQQTANFALMCLEIGYILLAVVLPVVTTMALTVLWIMPLQLKTQENMIRWVYIMDCWASFDVAVVVLLCGVLQFGRLSDFLIYKSDLSVPCTRIKSLTRNECMLVEMSARPTVAILLAAFVCVVTIPKAALRLCASSIFKKFCYGIRRECPKAAR